MSDPLAQGPAAAQELFYRFRREADLGGFTFDDQVGAACNVLLNVLRQANPSRRGAEIALDRVLAKCREKLDSHYDVAGNRRNVFAFNQVIKMPDLTKLPTVHG